VFRVVGLAGRSVGALRGEASSYRNAPFPERATIGACPPCAAIAFRMNANPVPAARIIITGGTFDKHYDAIKGELTFKDSHLPTILQQSRVTIPVQWEVNQLIDSINMQDEHRQQVLAACRAAPEDHIVVIHGTDTMRETAQVVGAAGLDKTVVFTGAMIPYSVQGSDALFNLGFALAVAQLHSRNTYIAMNGRVFPWNRVRKNKTDGVFELVD
jgi:L-asparaginase